MAVTEGDIIKVVAKMSLLGSIDVVNVFYLAYADTGSVSDVEVLEDADEYLTSIYTPLLPSMSDELTFETIKVYDAVTGDDIGEDAFITLVDGDSTFELLATGTALLLRALTSQGKFQGRKFIAGLVAGTMSDGQWTTGVIAQAVTAGLAYVTSFTSDNGHEWAPGIYNTGTTTFRPFLSSITSAIPGYQRRRKSGVGS